MNHALRYAHRVLAMVAAAEKVGVPLSRAFKVPEEAGRYAERAVAEIRRCQGGAPSARKRALVSAARRFANGEGWRGEIPRLGSDLGEAILALAQAEGRGKAGSPHKRSGASQIPERRYVNAAVVELVTLTRAKEFQDVTGILAPGARNAPSPGRRLIAHKARSLADADGITLNSKQLSAQIRERAKKPLDPDDALGMFLGRRRPKRRLIPIQTARD